MRAVARMLTMLPRLLDADLVREQQISLSTYLVLMNLSEADERRLRMSELAAICDLSLSGLTRIVDKLEASGFVERQRDAEDARVLRAHHPWRPRRQTPGLGAVHRVTLPPARPRKADRLRWAIQDVLGAAVRGVVRGLTGSPEHEADGREAR